MKCVRCRLDNPPESASCWACGVRLGRPDRRRVAAAFRPQAMRYYQASAIAPHRFWVDGLVLLSTVLFGLLLGYFALEVLPIGRDAEAAPQNRFLNLRALPNPLAFLSPAPRLLDVTPMGETQEAQSVVAQVVEPRRTRSEGGRQAAAGSEFLTVTAVLDNQSGRALTYSLQDWQVRDSRGRVRAAEALRVGGWLSGGTVEPGQRVQANVTFQIPEGDATPVVSFGPSALRVVMRWNAAPPAVS